MTRGFSMTRARFLRLLLPTLLVLLLFGWRQASAQTASPTPANPGEQQLGVWSGSTRAGCNVDSISSRCNAVQKVSITLYKGADGKLTGFYKCAYGNQDCYDLNERGKVVAASVTGKEVMMRVQMPDGSSCIFSGRNVGDDVNGGYSCANGGAPFERGVWRAHRSY
jgi:hypothetical protein